MILPDDRQRITVIGKTGSGKTQGGAWLLSGRSFESRPWIIFNWKHDDLLDEIPHVREIGVSDKLPKHPGLYMVHPTPADTEAVDAMLWAIWRRERIGLFIDESYMIPVRSEAFQAVLTQGRSKQIPVIQLTQRPSWITRFSFSEADYIQLYQLTDQRDSKVVKSFMPLPIERPLPDRFYSWWWDNGRNYRAVLKPVPSRNTILNRFYDRLVQRRRAI